MPPVAESTAPGASAPVPPSTEPARSAPTRGNRLAPWLIALVVAGLAVMWVYALFLAPSGSPDRLRDRSWAAAAEARCHESAMAIGALRPAYSFKDVTPLAEALRERAAVGTQANDLLAARIAALRALPTPRDEASRSLVDRWLADYDVFLADRRHHVDRWHNGENPPFAETASENGAPMSLRMDAFANTNTMPSCTVPQDFG